MKIRRDRIFWYVAIGLIVIGIVSQLRHLLIPVIVLGAIFLLYKFPPSRWKFSAGASRSSARKRQARKAKFRVIDGAGRDDDNEPPRYH